MKILVAIVLTVAPFLLAFIPADGKDQLEAIVAIATVEAVLVALFGRWIESLLDSPSISIEVGQHLIHTPEGVHGSKPLIWIRGKVTNKGSKTAYVCRARITEIMTGIGPRNSDLYNGYLQWQGGHKSTVSLNPEEHLVFDIGTRATIEQGRPLFLASYIGDNDVHEEIKVGQYTLTVKVFGDNFKPQSLRFRLWMGDKPDEIKLEAL